MTQATAERPYRYNSSRLHLDNGVPEGAAAAAQALLDSLPRDWDRVEAGAYYDDLQTYQGVTFVFWRGEQYVAFLLPDPREAEKNRDPWDHMVRCVRRAFKKADFTAANE